MFLTDTRHDPLQFVLYLFAVCVCNRVTLDDGFFFEIMILLFNNIRTNEEPEFNSFSAFSSLNTFQNLKYRKIISISRHYLLIFLLKIYVEQFLQLKNFIHSRKLLIYFLCVYCTFYPIQ